MNVASIKESLITTYNKYAQERSEKGTRFHTPIPARSRRTLNGSGPIVATAVEHASELVSVSPLSDGGRPWLR